MTKCQNEYSFSKGGLKKKLALALEPPAITFYIPLSSADLLF